MKTLYFDCSMGAAGDMLTGALLDLLPNRDEAVAKLNVLLDGKAVLKNRQDIKNGIVGIHVDVIVNGDEEGYAETHSHNHTSIKELLEIIECSKFPDSVKDDARAIYSMIAEAEQEVHGQIMENIHFHELGSLDAFADVLSVCYLIRTINPDKVIASTVNVGSGTVECSHGVLPVPAPATELLLRGIPYYGSEIVAELCTPTGAAILRHFVSEFGPMPTMIVSASGYGTGTKDFPQANVVRAMLGESNTDVRTEEIYEYTCNIDDMTGEEIGFAMDVLFDAGALDVYYSSIGMKKCRPGIKLTCMCKKSQKEQIIKCLFEHTSTLGIREAVYSRYTMEREIVTKELLYGTAHVKKARGYSTEKEKLEFDDIAKIAKENDISLREASKIK